MFRRQESNSKIIIKSSISPLPKYFLKGDKKRLYCVMWILIATTPSHPPAAPSLWCRLRQIAGCRRFPVQSREVIYDCALSIVRDDTSGTVPASRTRENSSLLLCTHETFIWHFFHFRWIYVKEASRSIFFWSCSGCSRCVWLFPADYLVIKHLASCLFIQCSQKWICIHIHWYTSQNN